MENVIESLESISEKYNLMNIQFDQIEQLEDKLGDGDYTGLLYGMPVIIRYIGINNESLQLIVSNLSKFNHPSFPINYGIMMKNNQVYIVRDLVKGKNFFSATNLDFHNLLVIIYKVICALEFIHSFNEYFTFLRPSKIICTTDINAKILDFIKDDKEILESLKKTPLNDEIRFYCPELYENNPNMKNPFYDIYSVGCLIFYGVFQELPWKDCNSKEEILYLYKNKEIFLESESNYENNKNFHRIVKMCLNNEYKSISELKEEWEKLEEIILFIKNDYVKVDYTKGKIKLMNKIF